MMSDQTEAVDVEQFAGDSVRLMTHIVGVMSTPSVIMGEVSGSGKTISAYSETFDESYRLDTAKVMNGDGEYRDSICVQLYTPERFQRVQRSNHAPGPQAGVNEVSDTEDLPDATHRPLGEDWVEDAPEDDDDEQDGEGSDGNAPTLMTDGGRDVETVPDEDGDPKPVSPSDSFSGSLNAWAHADETEMLHLLELIREGDSIRVNERQRPLTVTDTHDSEGYRFIHMTGNGTRYSLKVERDRDGEPKHAVLQYPSGSEYVSHATVDNRNVMNIRRYDRLMTEEMESVAPSFYLSTAPRDSPRSWRDAEWTVEGDDLTMVKWATWAFVRHYREGGRMGEAPAPLNYFQDALALWERLRDRRGQWTFYGAEIGLIGAFMDYAVEDRDIRERVPEPVLEALKADRVPELHFQGSLDAIPHPEDEDAPPVLTDGGEVPPERASEGDIISVEYDSPRSDEPLTREGKVLDVELWESEGADGEVDTIRFATSERECRVRFAPSAPHILEQKANQWTELGRTTSVTITSGDVETDGGSPATASESDWNPQPAKLREGETTDVNSHAAATNQLIQDAVEDMTPEERREYRERVERRKADSEDGGPEVRTDGGHTRPVIREVAPSESLRGTLDRVIWDRNLGGTRWILRNVIADAMDRNTDPYTAARASWKYVVRGDFRERLSASTEREIISAVAHAITDRGEDDPDPALMTDGGDDSEVDLLGGRVSEGDRLEMETDDNPVTGRSGYPESLTGEVTRSEHEYSTHSGELEINSGGEVFVLEYSPFGMYLRAEGSSSKVRLTDLREAPDVETDGGTQAKDERGPFGDDAPTFPSDMSTFEASVRRRISGNWSLASSVWELEDNSVSREREDGTTSHSNRITFHHRDSISRILIHSTGSWVDTDVTVEVFRPMSKAEARKGPEDDVNDLTVTVKTFDMLGEAVWFAEYFARTASDRVPENPAETLHGPVDGGGGGGE